MSTKHIQEIDKAASLWIVRRDSENWTEADEAGFKEWLSASMFNRVAYLRLEKGWEDAQRLKTLGAGVHSDEPPPRGHWNLTAFYENPPAPVGTHNKLLAMAAVVLIAVTVGWSLWPDGQIYETPIGVTAAVPMPDGTKIILNTDSRIRILVTNTERRVQLSRGEVFFDVAKDSLRPFVVDAGNRQVVAVGTQFSVRRDGRDVQVLVSEGRVRIETGDKAEKNILLAVGNLARATGAGVQVQTKELPEIEDQLSWRSGVLTFRNQTLGEAIAEFNRYNSRKILIEDESVGNLRIEGNFRSTNVDAFTRLLEQAYPIVVQSDAEKVRLKAR